MNLFAEETKQVLMKQLPEDWSEKLSDLISYDSFSRIGQQVRNSRYKAEVFPETPRIFQAFKQPFDKIKVVIIGQDPYHNGNADGLAFSCRLSLSPSLKMILEAIWYDECKAIQNPTNLTTMNMYLGNRNNWNLNYLAEQGVFLFNPTLTVERGKPNSHKGLWTPFSDAVIKALSSKEKLVWMLWGNEAKESVQKSIDDSTTSQHLILTNEHPAAAAYRKENWKCDHFTKCNQYLVENNLNEIEWIQR